MIGSVIAGATVGLGGSRLAVHLADLHAVPQNEMVVHGKSRLIVSENIADAVDELTDLACHARSKKPLYHVHLDPQNPLSLDELERYWVLFETEFGLTAQPFMEAVHRKKGRVHYHRVYSRVLENGTVIAFHHDFARREKIARILEYEFGGTHLPGRHNRTVIMSLAEDGRYDVAASMQDAELHSVPRPAADTTARERHQSERTCINTNIVKSAIHEAWVDSTSMEKFVLNLGVAGLELKRGKRAAIVVDGSGGVHSLTKALYKVGRREGQPIFADSVHAKLHLPLDEVQTSNGVKNDIETQSRTRMDSQHVAKFATATGRNIAFGSSYGNQAPAFGSDRSVWSERIAICTITHAAEGPRAANRIETAADTAAAGRDKQSPTDPRPAGKNSYSPHLDRQDRKSQRRRDHRNEIADRRTEWLLNQTSFEFDLKELMDLKAVLELPYKMQPSLEDRLLEVQLTGHDLIGRSGDTATILSLIQELGSVEFLDSRQQSETSATPKTRSAGSGQIKFSP